jgi:hypothetical protein
MVAPKIEMCIGKFVKEMIEIRCIIFQNQSTFTQRPAKSRVADETPNFVALVTYGIISTPNFINFRPAIHYLYYRQGYVCDVHAHSIMGNDVIIVPPQLQAAMSLVLSSVEC